MKERTEELIKYLDLLDTKIDSHNFASRIKAQKLAYITQKVLGKKLYTFGFYIRGPYSHGLAQEYFDNREEFAKGESNYVTTPPELEEITRIKPILNALSLTDLEIVASLIYLKMDKHLEENVAELELHKRKPHLKMEDIWRGSNTIKKLFLTEKLRETIMKSLHEETGDWDAISTESLSRFEEDVKTP